jgi:hypothetical protein
MTGTPSTGLSNALATTSIPLPIQTVETSRNFSLGAAPLDPAAGNSGINLQDTFNVKIRWTGTGPCPPSAPFVISSLASASKKSGAGDFISLVLECGAENSLQHEYRDTHYDTVNRSVELFFSDSECNFSVTQKAITVFSGSSWVNTTSFAVHPDPRGMRIKLNSNTEHTYQAFETGAAVEWTPPHFLPNWTRADLVYPGNPEYAENANAVPYPVADRLLNVRQGNALKGNSLRVDMATPIATNITSLIAIFPSAPLSRQDNASLLAWPSFEGDQYRLSYPGGTLSADITESWPAVESLAGYWGVTHSKVIGFIGYPNPSNPTSGTGSSFSLEDNDVPQNSGVRNVKGQYNWADGISADDEMEIRYWPTIRPAKNLGYPRYFGQLKVQNMESFGPWVAPGNASASYKEFSQEMEAWRVVDESVSLFAAISSGKFTAVILAALGVATELPENSTSVQVTVSYQIFLEAVAAGRVTFKGRVLTIEEVRRWAYPRSYLMFTQWQMKYRPSAFIQFIATDTYDESGFIGRSAEPGVADVAKVSESLTPKEFYFELTEEPVEFD